MTWLVESAIKTSIVILAGMAAAALMRRRSAALRHWILAATFGCAALLVPLGGLAPAWSIGLPATGANVAPPPSEPLARVEVIANSAGDGQRPAVPRELPQARGFTLNRGLLIVWIAGSVVHLFALWVGFGRLKALSSAAEEIDAPSWTTASGDLSRGYGLRGPVRLLRGGHAALLVSWGARSPKIMVPPSSADWSAERIRVVLAHELAHIARGDWAVQIGAELLRAVYWFNPLLWIACRRLRQESEHACDDAVVAAGIEPQHYAAHLLDLARAVAAHRQRWVPAVAIIARPSSLQLRIKAMLNSRLDRHPLTRARRVAVALLLLAITVPIAGFAQATFATVTGSVADQSNGVLPGAILALNNAQRQTKHEVRSDATGRFEFVGIPAGEYVLEASLPGFATRSEPLSVSGENVQRNFKLEVGMLVETLTVRGGVDTTEPVNAPAAASVQLRERRPLSDCEVPAAIGGQIRAPNRIRDVRPQYPAHLNAANIQGVVILSGVIGTNGSFRTLEVARTPHPDLATAALNAVSQWEFDETLLNCVPVETRMAITINFSK